LVSPNSVAICAAGALLSGVKWELEFCLIAGRVFNLVWSEKMPRHSALSIANEFLRLRAKTITPQQMLIQKLTYFAHGWNLAINNEPLVEELPEAWDNGPVYRSIWDQVKDKGYGPNNRMFVDPSSQSEISAELSPSERSIIEHVWTKYGSMSALKLSEMTHESNTPWSKAYFERGRNAPLSNEEIKDHYVALAMAGRDQPHQ
jgi:uncharacterized phage-associated protein